eukprot:gene3510-14117_t
MPMLVSRVLSSAVPHLFRLVLPNQAAGGNIANFQCLFHLLTWTE